MTPSFGLLFFNCIPLRHNQQPSRFRKLLFMRRTVFRVGSMHSVETLMAESRGLWSLDFVIESIMEVLPDTQQ